MKPVKSEIAKDGIKLFPKKYQFVGCVLSIQDHDDPYDNFVAVIKYLKRCPEDLYLCTTWNKSWDTNLKFMYTKIELVDIDWYFKSRSDWKINYMSQEEYVLWLIKNNLSEE